MARSKTPPEPTLEWFKGYEVRAGGDGKLGVYTRGYNCRLATFNANTAQLSTRLRLLFERANKPVHNDPPRKPRKTDKRQNPGAREIRRHPKFKRTGNDARDFGFAMDVGDNQGWGKK